MKKFAFIAAAAILTLGTLNLSAQDKKESNYGWKEKMMSEKEVSALLDKYMEAADMQAAQRAGPASPSGQAGPGRKA